MTNRVTLPPQDFERMCKQAERDHEARKLVILMEKVKRQIAERENPESRMAPSKAVVTAINGESSVLRLPSRSVPLER